MAKKQKRTKTKQQRDFENAMHIIDAGLALNDLMRHILGPLNYPNFKYGYACDEAAVEKFYKLQPKDVLHVPSNLADMYQNYKTQRLLLNDYHKTIEQDVFLSRAIMRAAAQELGNVESSDVKPVLQNESEVNLFYNYIVLYRSEQGKRYVYDLLEKHPKALNKNNEAVVLAFVHSKFAVLRLDKNLTDGAIQVVDMISEKPYLLVDKALNASPKEGCFFVCSLLDMENYVMTSGGGVCIDGTSRCGKVVLTMIVKHREEFRAGNPDDGVKEIYGYCLCNGALEGSTANYNY